MDAVYKRWGLGLLGMAIIAILTDALFLEKYFFKIKQFWIGKKGTQKRLKLLLLTDIHLVSHLRPYHIKLAHKINTINPDLLLIAGDIIDESGKLQPAKHFFALVNKHIPKLSICGNHDHKSEVSISALKELLAQNNGQLLINETRQVLLHGEVLTITGVDDFIEGHSDLTHALSGIGAEKHHLLMIHSPLQQELIQKELQDINKVRSTSDKVNFQYIFAGHTHGGQIRLGKIVPVLPEQSGHYINGWYNKQRPYLFVSKGFGTSTIPFRFGARSEIILFHYGV
jgi:predicted MPP superfamily phosphohydrolase